MAAKSIALPFIISLNAPSPMTHSAIPQFRQSLRAYVIFFDQLSSALSLIRSRLPFHVENLIPGPKMALRRFVAIAAINSQPAHVVLMAEGHFLRARHIHIGCIG